MGSIERIYIAPGKRRAVQRIESAELEAGTGIVGDRYHGLALQYLEKDMPVPANHISLVEREKLDAFIARHGLQVDYGDFRRSVITRDIDLNALVGHYFRWETPCVMASSSVNPAASWRASFTGPC